MVEREDPVDNETELKELVTNGKPGLECSAAGQGTCSHSSSDVDRIASLLKKLDRTAIIAISVAIFFALAFIVSVSFNISQHEENLKLEEKLEELQSTTALPPSTACPPKWIKNGSNCYLFSAAEGTWDSSQRNCSLYGASLATVRSREEWAFLKQHRRPTEYWLNLRRDNVEEPWGWPGGSHVDSWLPVGGEGLCGYLNEKAASSTTCDNDRAWICSKPVSST